MRKWLCITGFVGLALLLVAAGSLIIWKALRHVPDFYREAMAATPAIQEESGDETIQEPAAPESNPKQVWEALFALAVAQASAREADPTVPPQEGEAGNESIQPAPPPARPQEAPAALSAPREKADDETRHREQEDDFNSLFTRASALADDREAGAVGPGSRGKTRHEMPRRAAASVSDRGKGGRWDALFTAQEINNWLALDLGAHLSQALHGSLSDLRVTMEPQGLKVAGRYKHGKMNTVVSLSGEAYLAGQNVVGVRIRRAQAGAVPLPLSRIEAPISEAGRRSGLRLQWQNVGGDLVALIWLPLPTTGAHRPARIETLRLGQGEIYLSGPTE